MFISLFIVSIFIYLFSIGILIYISRTEATNRVEVYLHSALQYICLSMLSLAFISGILYYQENGYGHPIGTFDNGGFLSDLATLSFLFVVVLVYNMRLIRSFCQPIFTKNSIKGLHKFILYLRPFNEDGGNVEKLIKRFAKATYPAISIANPHSVVQGVDSDKIFTDDTEWKSAVQDCMTKCEYTIIHVGDTDGCMWELKQCEEGYFKKTFFVVTSKKAYEILRNFIKGINSLILIPMYNGGQQVYFLENPNNIYSWKTYPLNTSKDVKFILSEFQKERREMTISLSRYLEYKKHPFKSLFNDECFPNEFGWLSFAGISLFAFPFMGRLKWQYWITLIPIAIVLTVLFGQFGLLITSLLITIVGKRMVWLSGRWSGTNAINSQINLVALSSMICLILSFICGSIYLSKHPIDHTFKRYMDNYSATGLVVSLEDTYRQNFSSEIAVEKSKCPIKTNDVFTISDIDYSDGIVTYHIIVNEEKGYCLPKEKADVQKLAILDNYKQQPNYELIKNTFVNGNITAIYKYTNSISGDVVMVRITTADWE